MHNIWFGGSDTRNSVRSRMDGTQNFQMQLGGGYYSQGGGGDLGESKIFPPNARSNKVGRKLVETSKPCSKWNIVHCPRSYFSLIILAGCTWVCASLRTNLGRRDKSAIITASGGGAAVQQTGRIKLKWIPVHVHQCRSQKGRFGAQAHHCLGPATCRNQQCSKPKSSQPNFSDIYI